MLADDTDFKLRNLVLKKFLDLLSQYGSDCSVLSPIA